MALINQSKMMGVVGYTQLYPEIAMPPIEQLLSGIPRIWAIRLVSNIQNKLVGKPFFNPHFTDEKTSQIDVPRFFLGPDNYYFTLDVVRRYRHYIAKEEAMQMQPMECAAASETPLLLLKHIMAAPEYDTKVSMPSLERNLFTAFLVANQTTMNRDQGVIPYGQEDIELYVASLLLSRFAYNDFTNNETELIELVRNQSSRTICFFDFICNNSLTKDLYNDFLKEYEISSWHDYIRTYWAIITFVQNKTGVLDFKRLRVEDGLLSERIVDKDSIDIHEPIPLEKNVDYTTFRERPFIKIAPHEYVVIDISFLISRMYDGLYFIFNELWTRKHPDDKKRFNQIYTTELSEENILTTCLKEVAKVNDWFSLSDKECKSIIREDKLSSPPDFYIRAGKDVYLFECKDIKIQKEIKANGTIQQLLMEINKNLVGHLDKKGKRKKKGVGQLVRNAKRIQENLFAWDKVVDNNSRIFLVLVLADSKQVAAGWKNYLNRKMQEECARQKVNCKNVMPLILMDLGTLILYKYNFMENGFLNYFLKYCQETEFDTRKIASGDRITAIVNQTLSFSGYMSNEKIVGGDVLWQDIKRILQIKRSS